MSGTVPVEIKFQGNDNTWFSANATLVLDANVIAFHIDGRYKYGDGTTELQNLPFRGGSNTGSQTEENFNVTGTTINLTNTPSFVYGVFKNGQRLTTTEDYTISTNTITLNEAAASDLFTVVYSY